MIILIMFDRYAVVFNTCKLFYKYSTAPRLNAPDLQTLRCNINQGDLLNLIALKEYSKCVERAWGKHCNSVRIVVG